MKGFFKPHNPQKYKGNPTNICYRSSWELNLFMKLDRDNNVSWWQSEEVIVPYQSPLDNHIRRYFPDVVVKYNLPEPHIVMYEIKPRVQTYQPVQHGNNQKRFIKEATTYAKNKAKWEAAKRYCEARGWQFKIITENELGIPNYRRK